MEAIYLGLMNGEWNQSMNNHPEVKLPLWSIWDHIGLWMYWNRSVQVNMMNNKLFKELVTVCQCFRSQERQVDFMESLGLRVEVAMVAET
jgi:hypothetical protein